MKKPIWAVVPYKGTTNSKQRLASEFDPEERAGLVHAMLSDVIKQLKYSEVFDEILLVSRATDAPQIAHKFGITFHKDPCSNLADALIDASHWLHRIHAVRSVFIVPGDVPLITPQDVRTAVSQHEQVTVIPDQSEVGTNGLICTPPNAFPYIFDGSSFKPHLRAAERHQLNPRVLKLKSFALDVDTSADILSLLQDSPANHTKEFLLRIRAPERLVSNCRSSAHT